ncbi:unnamed protein product [Bodo saltans]|uniref:Uncharacterized protein n=1 Tax=Bodo saltans TaxID=75058 RepID=A0A0S4JPU6_BODSA|nr:unnamed protein product [Bodo saltans]|eukprot:CUG92526.1 unnamed protein product [Bodo saltans]
MKEFIQLSLNIADRRVSLWVRYSRTVLVAQKRDPQGRTAPIARALRADPSCSWVVKALNYVFRQAQRIFERNVRKLRQSVPIDNAPLYQTHVLNRDFASLTALHSEANERIGEAERP